LRGGARFDKFLAGLDLDAAIRAFATKHFDLIAVLLRRRAAHPQFAFDIGGFDTAPGFKPGIKRLQHVDGQRHRHRVAHHRQAVAPAHDLHRQLLFDGGQIAVVFTAKVDQQKVVGKFDGLLRGYQGSATLI
jgi:hypothetical protein